MSANIKNENTEHVDLTSILKDVENCIRSGLSNKLDTFFYEYDKYKKTHEEVLNLSIVRDLLKRGSSVISNVSEGTKPKLDPDLEMIVLRNQVIFLRGEVNKYKNQAEALVLAQAPEQAPELESELESSQLNLEIKEKETEPLDIKSEDEDGDGDEDISDNDGEEDGDGDVSETSSNGDGSDDGSDDDKGVVNTNTKYLPHIVEDSIQNIVLNVTEKNAEVVADEEQAEEEEEEEEEAEEEAEEEVVVDEEEAEEEAEEEEEEEVVADEEEEEDMPVKMPTFPTKTKPAVEVKPVIVEEEEEEEEDEVETETEEDSDEEEEAEPAPAPAPEPELKTSAPEEEEEEEELYEVEINGVMYVTNDDEDGTIYSYVNEEVGDKVGEFKGLVAHIYKGKNKGIYDRTMCKMNF